MTSPTETLAPAASDQRRDDARGLRSRIDPPHATGATREGEAPAEPAELDLAAALEQLVQSPESPAPELIAALTGQLPEVAQEQLQLQAAQLAEHLRERLREVDRRESQVNARMAQLEADARASRLWLSEREGSFQEREAQLQRQIDDLREQLGGDTESTGEVADFESRQNDLLAREHQVQLKENELRERRFEIERQAAALRHSQQIWQQEQGRQQAELARERERLTRDFERKTADRDQTLRGAETLLSDHVCQLEQDRAALIADRRNWTEEQTAQRAALDIHKQTVEAQLADLRSRLDARQEWIERQKAGLEQVRGEILTHHRQALEMRLIAEQLWSQVGGRMTPAEATQAIAQLRLKLGEHYRLEEASLDERKRELVALAERIQEQHREMKQLQGGVRDWAAARQAEIEQQAEQLVRRELALDEQQQALQSSQHQWQAERRSYEQQIRQMQSELRNLPAAA